MGLKDGSTESLNQLSQEGKLTVHDWGNNGGILLFYTGDSDKRVTTMTLKTTVTSSDDRYTLDNDGHDYVESDTITIETNDGG
jgi:hypothetical protein